MGHQMGTHKKIKKIKKSACNHFKVMVYLMGTERDTKAQLK